MTKVTGCLYIVHDENVINCDYNHRVILYVTLDEQKAKEFAKQNYTLQIAKIQLDSEAKIVENFFTIEGLSQ